MTIKERMEERVIGQPKGLAEIASLVQIYNAGLSPTNRPAGIVFLMGPTGTGKTHTVAALAEVLHGAPKKVLKVNCGEFQHSHEISKLIGAPPGYLGHETTRAVLSNENLHEVTSTYSDISIVLFDEIEKAHDSVNHLLLGILDNGTLRIGNGKVVDFQKTLVFLTSNVGAREMESRLTAYGFDSDDSTPVNLDSTCLLAVRRKFTPEFINRIDVFATYGPLSREHIECILDMQLRALNDRIQLAKDGLRLVVSKDARQFLLGEGVSIKYGAREIKRVIQRFITQPLAALIVDGVITGTKSIVTLTVNTSGKHLDLAVKEE